MHRTRHGILGTRRDSTQGLHPVDIVQDEPQNAEDEVAEMMKQVRAQLRKNGKGNRRRPDEVNHVPRRSNTRQVLKRSS